MWPRIVYVWMAAVALAVVWQPLELGFYLDDWLLAVAASRQGAAFSTGRLSYAFTYHERVRPAMALLRYVFASLLSDHPVAWHVGLLAANAAVGLAIGLLVAALARPSPRPRLTSIAVCAGLAWLVLPWTAAAKFWPLLLPGEVFVALFVFLLVWILKRWDAHAGPALVPALVYLTVCLAYEQFYFQFVAVGLLGYALCLSGRFRFSDVTRTLAGLVLAQTAAVVWYVVSARLTTGQRPIAEGWPGLLVANLWRLPSEILRSTAESAVPLVIAVVTVTIIGVHGAVLAARADGQRRVVKGFLLALVACLIGALLSITAVTLGGYEVLGIGVVTRYLTIGAAWSLVAVGALIEFGHRHAPRPAGVVLGAAFVLGATALLIGHLARGGEWARAWKLQQQILAEAPVERMALAEPAAHVLLVAPTEINGAAVFTASWEINTAMPLTHESISHLEFFVYNHWEGPLTWDGRWMAYPGRLAGKARTLYVWKPEQREFYQATRPFTVHEDRTIADVDVPAEGLGAPP